jgi:hypothetical protein
VDGNAGSYWESSGAFPQWLQVDLGAGHALNRLVLRLPPGWERRSQTITVQGSTDGSSFGTLAGAAAHVFDPAAGNTVTVTLPGSTARYVRLSFAANTGWPAAQLAQLEAYAGAAPPPPPAGDLARGKPTAESSHVQSYGAGALVDGDPNTYWESSNNAFPQWAQVDLGAAVPVGRVVLALPASWGARSQTVALTGSTDGVSFRSLSAAASRSFNPGAGNRVTVTFTPGPVRYVRATVTANTGWPAGQLSTMEVHTS